jgi:hypothetical protein
MSVEIPVHQHGEIVAFALVDDRDAEFVNLRKWNSTKGPRKVEYATASLDGIGSNIVDIISASSSLRVQRPHRTGQETGQNIVSMQNLLLGPPPEGYIWDHKNRNGLDNRRLNLRLATYSQNIINRAGASKSKPPVSGFKGVKPFPKNRTNPWLVRLNRNGKLVYSGYFKTPELAARAYDSAALKHFGEFAYTNFVDAWLWEGAA